ncbi:MAG: YicC family protein [Thermodesulfobacteriota bacterium]|nr:MAG: YicC family protein [Thermodesulfobacteriota bacterium]
MTGFGRSTFTVGGEEFFVEVRSLNHRYLDTRIKVPDRFFGLENLIRDEIKKRFSRGSFKVSLFSEESGASGLKINLVAARAYFDAALEIKEALGVKGEPDLGFILAQREVLSAGKESVDVEAESEVIREGVSLALDQVEAWRVKEGESLEKDLKERLQAVRSMLSRIEARLPLILDSYRKRVTEEIKRMLGDRFDESRILLEAAVFAERTDVSEEVVRLGSHFKAFDEYLKLKEPVGKRLDFLCQEIFRETNTIASKASDASVSQTVVEVKWEVEKMREQVQNIE